MQVSSAAQSDPLIILIDDTRSFHDGRACLVARTSAQGVDLLQSLRGVRIDELWLDHDLGGADDIWPVVRHLEEAELSGAAFDIRVVYVQASRPGPAHRIGVSMRRLGYRTERPHDLRIWARRSS